MVAKTAIQYAVYVLMTVDWVLVPLQIFASAVNEAVESDYCTDSNIADAESCIGDGSCGISTSRLKELAGMNINFSLCDSSLAVNSGAILNVFIILQVITLLLQRCSQPDDAEEAMYVHIKNKLITTVRSLIFMICIFVRTSGIKCEVSLGQYEDKVSYVPQTDWSTCPVGNELESPWEFPMWFGAVQACFAHLFIIYIYCKELDDVGSTLRHEVTLPINVYLGPYYTCLFKYVAVAAFSARGTFDQIEPLDNVLLWEFAFAGAIVSFVCFALTTIINMLVYCQQETDSCLMQGFFAYQPICFFIMVGWTLYFWIQTTVRYDASPWSDFSVTSGGLDAGDGTVLLIGFIAEVISDIMTQRKWGMEKLLSLNDVQTSV